MKMPRRMRLALTALALSSQAAAEPPPVCKQANAPIQARVQDLLGRMTLEEKVAQLQSNSTLPPIPGLAVGPTPAFGIVKKGQVDEATAKRALANGVCVAQRRWCHEIATRLRWNLRTATSSETKALSSSDAKSSCELESISQRKPDFPRRILIDLIVAAVVKIIACGHLIG
jgi:hypothetical protein